VDRTIFHEEVRADRLLPDTTVFFTVGKFELRKGHDLLVEAFNAAFEPGDRVALRMLSLNPFLGARNNEWIARFKTSKLGAKIEIYPQRLQTQAEVAQFMKAGDVGVWPARAEGFNLDLLEAMSLGMPVIATDYSAHTQFVTAANCQLLRHEGLTTAHDGIWFHGEGEWCRPSLEHLVEILRSCHRQKQTGALPRNDAGIRTAQNFSWSKFSSAITNQIGTL
jgi:glycosyltransferase involved in cell wall biosynthesis